MAGGEPVANISGQGRRGPNAGTDLAGDLIGQDVYFVEFHFVEESHHHGGGERIARTDGIHNLDRH